MQGMFHSIKDELIGGVIIKSKTVTCNIGEGLIANHLKYFEDKYNDVKIGSYPYFNPNGFGTSVVIRSKNIKTIDKIIEELIKIIKKLNGNYDLIG